MKINAVEVDGTELVEMFLQKLVENKVVVAGEYPNNGPHTVFNVQNKNGEWVAVGLEKVKLVFNR